MSSDCQTLDYVLPEKHPIGHFYKMLSETSEARFSFAVTRINMELIIRETAQVKVFEDKVKKRGETKIVCTYAEKG